MENSNIPLAILIGIISTTQLHLAKALERQGIEVFDQLRARIRKTNEEVEGGIRKPLIYSLGLILNNTIFIYTIAAQRYAPPAVYTSMFGIGLIFLMAYAALVLGEKITRGHALGSGAIITGTLVIGVENILRQDYDRFQMSLTPTLILVGTFITAGLVIMFFTGRITNPILVAGVFGIFCGGLGSLDPFLKGAAQNMGGYPEWIPTSSSGWIIFLPSFVVGFVAFALTQVGFAKKAPASVLIPFYNASYILLPVILQLVLLPTYRLYWSTVAGIAFIILGMGLMRNVGR